MSDLCATNEQTPNKDEIIAKLEQERDSLRAALDGARRELFLVKARHAEAACREKHERHMGWHPEFDPHDMSKVTITVDPDVFGKKIALPLPALESVFARRVFRNLRGQLRRLSARADDMSARRELVATAYQKIAAMHVAPRWRQWLASFLSAAKVL